MPEEIVVAIPTLSCYDRLYRLCKALDEDTSADIGLVFSIMDNGGKLRESEYFDKLKALQSPVYLEVPPYNLGVAPSWNRFIYNHGRCIIANDDAIFSKRDISLFLQAAEESPETILFVPSNQGGGFTVMLVNQPSEWLMAGGFDETFAPAYFEDNDACWRLKLMGKPEGRVELLDWSHDNSSTLHSGDEQYQRNHWCSFNRNQRYYVLKWGGVPGHERFSCPFDKQL